jgi:hypothetical protein
MKWLIQKLRDPAISKIDIDGKDRLFIHSEILSRKPMLRQVFTEFHHIFRRLDEQFFSAEGTRIELGAGAAPIRDSYADVLATDVVSCDHLDKVLDAENLDLPDRTVRAIYGQNCFHHFPHPEQFFKEAERVLRPGGGIILLEPYYGLFASFLFKNLFNTEGFDKNVSSWETAATGPMNGANQALSYIIFVRDRALFQKKYPNLKIIHQEICGNQLEYLLSGGLNFRQLLPSWMNTGIRFLQWIFSPFNRWLSIHHIIVIRKEQFLN